MQYLKDEVRQKIYHAAKSEFTSHGYAEASIRNIAKIAGISSGNVYRYFDNKETLFDEIVGGVYANLMARLLEIEVLLINGPHRETNKENCIEHVDHLLLELFENNEQELMILLFKSHGSKYEKLRKELADLIERFLLETHDFTKVHPDREDHSILLARAVASSLIEATCSLLSNCTNGQETRVLLNEFLKIHALGIKNFFNTQS